jgi:hypothetical protein
MECGGQSRRFHLRGRIVSSQLSLLPREEKRQLDAAALQRVT